MFKKPLAICLVILLWSCKEETQKGLVMLKNMETGEQSQLEVNEIIGRLGSGRE